MIRHSQTKLRNAFAGLRAAGYFARQNWQCCQSCGFAAVPKGTERAVFYHAQDAEMRDRSKPFYLSWDGDGAQIVGILRDAGIDVEWDGDKKTRILVRPDGYKAPAE